MTTLLDVAEAAERAKRGGVEAMLALVRVVGEYVEERPQRGDASFDQERDGR